MILLAGLLITAAVIVGVAQAAQFGDGKAGFSAHGGQPRPGNFCFRAQRVAQEQVFEDALSLLRLSQRSSHLSLYQLVGGAVGGRHSSGGRQDSLSTFSVAPRSEEHTSELQ